jgi:hypothetical protein
MNPNDFSGPAAQFLRPVHPSISELAGVVIFNALFLVTRRVRFFGVSTPDSAMGWRGLAVVPIRYVAKLSFYALGLCTVGVFVLAAHDFGVRLAGLALCVGFAIAYAINYLVSRYEEKLFPRKQHASTVTT